MVRLSQGEAEEEKSPFEIIDGRNERTKEIDTEIRVWYLKHPAPEVKRPSELGRGDGLQLTHKFGIAVCIGHQGVRSRSKRFLAKSCARPCSYLTIVRNGVKLPRCRDCRARVWAKYEDVVFQHDDLRVIKGVIQDFRAWRGRNPEAIVSPALFNTWARRIGEKLTMRTFYDHLPWNLDFHAQGGQWCGPR